VASVLLDVDHLPPVFGPPLVRTRTRPATHSLAVVMGVACMVLLVSGHQRSVLGGIAAGCAAHLARDVATGSAPLAWPIRRSGVGVPYAAYAAVMIALTRLLSQRTCGSRKRRGIG
jgi:hypothetical protein